jgi:hypothetical protein
MILIFSSYVKSSDHRNLDTLTKFKKAIRKEQSDNTKRIPKHFYYGPRKLNIIKGIIKSEPFLKG